ncbi:MAG: hypothetical protein HKN78_07870 [Sphingomonadaceae bacterium]|nr:hypothetical protein [Sphingomonadaceae bacterium]
MKYGIVLTAALALVPFVPAYGQDSDAGSGQNAGDAARDVIMTPARDLNLEGEDIPPALANLRSPYEPLSSRDCSTIRAHVAELDAALGPDEDVPRPEDDDDTVERVGEVASSIVGGLILPFRGIVRQISGARDRERAVLAAQIRGVARRSYLKGLGQALGCSAPAAPTGYIPPVEPDGGDESGDESN